MRLCLTLFTRAHRTLAAFERGCQMAGVVIISKVDRRDVPESVYLISIPPDGVVAPRCRVRIEPAAEFRAYGGW